MNPWLNCAKTVKKESIELVQIRVKTSSISKYACYRNKYNLCKFKILSGDYNL